MTSGTHEHTINDALGEVLAGLRQSWTTRTERIGEVLRAGGRPDVLIEEASGWPVIIEAERNSHTEAEKDAKNRLGKTVASTGRQIETAIALVYPPVLHDLDGQALRGAIADTQDLEYALYTHQPGEEPERLPSRGWIKGNVRDLAMLVHRAAVPPPRIERLAIELENGVRTTAENFSRNHPAGSELRRQLGGILGQSDDNEGQTLRMALTVVANALVFHESLAKAGFEIPEVPGGPHRGVRPVDSFRSNGIFLPSGVRDEWELILTVNYWPIFWSAKEILRHMDVETAHEVLNRLWRTVEELVAGGVTKSHDLMGIVFQSLIADRKFLATYYTRPEAAALLAALALPANKPPGGADWSDGDTLVNTQIGDFACGTGTLLSTAYQRMSLLHELHGGDPSKLHGPLMKHGLVGLDVLNIAVHLTAAMLAGSHPDTPFDGECLLTMPYGEQAGGDVAIGSLDLLAEVVQESFMRTAAAVSAGGREPDEIRDLVSRVGHSQFDLVIMNPPFTRPTGMEGDTLGTGNPAFAAFNTSKPVQSRMQSSLSKLRGGTPIGTGNAGLAADFFDLALRKARNDGTIALVLPLSAVSGNEWNEARKVIADEWQDVTVVTIAGAGSYDSSFSADTGMAECLLIARRGQPYSTRRATFVMLRRRPRTAAEAEILASEILRAKDSRRLRTLEGSGDWSAVTIGDEAFGDMVNAPIPESGPWQLAGILDSELAQAAWNLQVGRLFLPGQANSETRMLPIVPIGQIAHRGPYHADIYWDNADGTPRGPFKLVKPAKEPVPTDPMLWAHDAKSERNLIVRPDSEGEPKQPIGRVTREDMEAKVTAIRATATGAHYNRDLQFNSQSLTVAVTERPSIGGAAWPSVIFDDTEHEFAFSLWCNSTLGLLLHWWVSNKTQSGRGRTSVTGIPEIPTLNVTTLSSQQIAAAKDAFGAVRDLRFLPFDQIDEDPARAELDRRLLVDVLGLPESLCEDGGPIDLLRRKLANEPQIHGGKKRRVVFLEPDGETSQKRGDR